jgi:hypothetical protein
VNSQAKIGFALAQYGFGSPLLALVVFALAQTSAAGLEFALFLPLGAVAVAAYRESMGKTDTYTTPKEFGLTALSSVGLTAIMGVVGVFLYYFADG